MTTLPNLARFLAPLLVVATSIANVTGLSAADDTALCNTSANNPDAGIPACTRLIELGGASAACQRSTPIGAQPGTVKGNSIMQLRISARPYNATPTTSSPTAIEASRGIASGNSILRLLTSAK